MKSIPAAMTWEMLRRGRWHLLLALLGGIAFPTVILFALHRDGALNPLDRSMLMINQQLMLVSALFMGAALFGAQSQISHLYAHPIRTSSLVAWRIFPGMLLMAVAVVVCVSFLNWLFNLQWPLWGPAIMMAVMLAAVQAAAWLTEKSVGWAVVAMTVVALLLGFWFRSRYGAPFSDPTRLWEPLRPTELFTMLAMAAAAYGVAVFAAARNRRGAPPLSIGFWEWVYSFFSTSPSLDRPLSSPIDAQLRVEWTRKGWVMPATVVSVMAFCLIAWFFGSRSPEDLFLGFFIGGYATWLLGFVGGLALGNIGPNDANFAMGHFMATRPISNSDLGRVLLRTAMKSVFLSWTIWAAAFAITCVSLWGTGAADAMKLPAQFHWAHIPATLLGPWVVTGMLMSVGLVGRTRYIIQLACIIPGAVILVAVFGRLFLSREMQALTTRMLLSLLCTAIVFGAGLIFLLARRKGLVPSSSTWAAAAIWIAAVAISVVQVPKDQHPIWFAYLLLAAFMALAISPFAAVPLALSWNRHR